MDISFHGKRALVTGAGKGIGRALAIKLVQCGARTVALSRTQEDLDSLKKEWPTIETCCVCLSNWQTARQAVESLGHFDLLVNNAGVVTLAPFLEVTEEDFDYVMNNNLKSVLNVSQLVSRSMVANKTGGSIVHLSSVASKIGLDGHTAYNSSKGAVDSLASVMALELGPHGIRTNCVNPTVTNTALAVKVWSDPAKADPLRNRIPLKRFAEVSDVVDAVLFLLSDKASYLNGVTLPVEGGLLVA